MKGLAFLVTLTSLLLVYTYIEKTRNISSSERYRIKLLEKARKWPDTWITGDERQDVISMVEQVLSIGPLTDRESENDYGGAIGSIGMRHLYLSPLLLLKSGFQHDRVLALTLIHESIHWKQLKTEEFQVLRLNVLDPKTVDFLILATKMEIEAYSRDYETTQRFNKLDTRFLLPTCFEFITRTEHIPVTPTARKFGYGRALISLHKRINDREDLTVQQKYDLYDESVLQLSAITQEYRDIGTVGPIDCKNKHGGD